LLHFIRMSTDIEGKDNSVLVLEQDSSVQELEQEQHMMESVLVTRHSLLDNTILVVLARLVVPKGLMLLDILRFLVVPLVLVGLEHLAEQDYLQTFH